MRLADVMITEVYTASEETPVSEVAAAMVEGRFGSAVIKRGSRVCGIFTERDALRAVAQGCKADTSPVGDWMTSAPMTAAPEMELDEAAAAMIRSGFRHLPVMRGEDVVGIVSIRDVLRVRVGTGD